MSEWLGFLDELGEEVTEKWNALTNQPGQVMICFVNRYLEALDGVKYKIKHGQQIVEGQTTAKKHCVTISPGNFKPIDIYVWSRMQNDYKKLDGVIPDKGTKKLVRKVMKTYKADGKTELHPKNTAIAPPPPKHDPAPPSGPSPKDKQGVKPILGKDESTLSQTKVERPVPDKITKEQLKKIFVQADYDHLQKIADELNKDLVKFKLDTPIRRAHFFGQTRQETGTKAKGGAESFDYAPKGLIATFGYYQRKPEEAQEDGRLEKAQGKKKKKTITQEAKQEVIANKVYGQQGAAKALGNEKPDDGWRFRGRGLKQLTGRNNYNAFTKKHSEYWGEEVDFTTNPDLVGQLPYSIRSAVSFWLSNKCWSAADNGVNDDAIDAVTKIVNSGEIRNHMAGKYAKSSNPVINRRTYTKLAYSAFV